MHRPVNGRNPEEERLEELFRKRDRMAWEAAHMAPAPRPKMQPKERAAAIRQILDRTHPDKTDEWKIQRLREILGTKPTPAKKAAPVKIRKTKPVPEYVMAIMREANAQRAAQFGIKEPGEIQYR